MSAGIRSLRGFQVLLDSDLAAIYGVTTAALNQAVKRNEPRFPVDFRFQLQPEEVSDLKSQFVISSLEHGGRRFLPWDFADLKQVFAALRRLLEPPKSSRPQIGFKPGKEP